MERRIPAIKTIGRSGQIALGKQYAGQHVLVDELEPGVWMIKLGKFIPQSERWLHQSEARARLDRAIRWAEAHPETAESDLDGPLASGVGAPLDPGAPDADASGGRAMTLQSRPEAADSKRRLRA